jgi:hypothetical protein
MVEYTTDEVVAGLRAEEIGNYIFQGFRKDDTPMVILGGLAGVVGAILAAVDDPVEQAGYLAGFNKAVEGVLDGSLLKD